LENMTELTSSEPAPTRGLASRSVARRNISENRRVDGVLGAIEHVPGDRSDLHHLWWKERIESACCQSSISSLER